MEEMSKNKKDFISSIKLLKSYLKSFEDGDKLFYLPMAVELRKLFCDKNPLIISIIPDLKLKKLHVTEMIEQGFITPGKLVNMVPGCLEFENGEVKKFTLTLSLNLAPVGINNWIDQIFFKEGITIRELIKSVADKEAAHADVVYNNTLKYTRSWSFGSTFSHVYGIYGIACLVCEVLDTEYTKYFE